jgi:alcohol dehydrogenase (cytochrome c)
VAPWLTGSFDAELNLVYWGTGNAAADFDNSSRLISDTNGTEANLYTASIVAIDVNTGELRWYHQEVPGDVWDYDSAYECLLVDRQIGGQLRRLLVHMGKTGLVFVLDRVTGELVRVFSVPEVRTWITGVTEDGKLVGRKEPEQGKSINVCPSVLGAKSWNSMAYSLRTGLLYIPVVETCNEITAHSQEAKQGETFMGGSMVLNLPPNRTNYAHIDAWDPVTGKRVWTYPYKYLLGASMLATAGGLVFTGDPEGHFFALDARSGKKLWSFQTGAGHRGSAISYSVNGRQYIATPTGWQQAIGGRMMSQLFPDQEFRGGSSLVVFRLP